MKCRICGGECRDHNAVHGNDAWRALDATKGVAVMCSACRDDRAFAGVCARYGLTPDQYWQMFEAQGRRCGICRATPARNARLRIDHDHASGTVRGLLCGRCNTGLGSLGDTIESLAAAVAYLKRSTPGVGD